MVHHQMKNHSFVLFMAVILIVSMLGGVFVSPAYAQGGDSVPVKYFGADGSLIRQDLISPGETIPTPPTAPKVAGKAFSHWYLVDDQLNGNNKLVYDFCMPVQSALNLRALYVDLPTLDESAAEEQAKSEKTKESETLISEAEVDTFLVLFYNQDGTLLHEMAGVKGSPVEKPEQNPQQAGQVFSHWYLVDEHLQGDAFLPYDFERAITGPTYLRAQYLPQQQEPQISENPENEDAVFQNIAEEAAVQFSVALAVEGGQVQDGAYQALLTGADLPEAGIAVANVGEEFPFPELRFTAEDAGTHVFQVEALVEEPLPFHTYDLRVQEVQVEVLVEENGHVTAFAGYPQGADHLLITHSVQTLVPTVHVYANILPGQTIQHGDVVVFTAELEGCGESPRIQWQYSPDNQTWTDIAGGDSARLSIQITPSNAAGYWRAAVTITD
jgi:hypothetical protein